MKTSIFTASSVAAALASCPMVHAEVEITHPADSTAIIHITSPSRYLLLPIQEDADESLVSLDSGDSPAVEMDIRLARTRTDYLVPFALPDGASEATLRIARVPRGASCWKEIRLSDTFDTSNTEKFRSIYHHTPAYGWMNDANGLVYKDGEYHLYYQYNPYGSMWGNMHWGHSVSRDLMHWEHRPVALARDTLGHIFSGSSVVDTANTAGYGPGAIVAFYTSHSDKNGQIQCMAYSTDNGNTFTKYENNPVVTPFDGLRDFRDPKVFWYEPDKKWVMIISADKEMRFYSSRDLKEWSYLSAWGNGYGVQPRQFECPDMVQIPVEGDPSRMKWVMLVNVNPGCYFGGSGTQYFVGDFDGTTFTCDSPKETVKWLDWGKDHYATVCFSNTGSRVIAVPWMSNWQYANLLPTRQFRSANALPRELALYVQDGELYLSAAPVSETTLLRKEIRRFPSFKVDGTHSIDSILPANDGAFELEMTLADAGADTMGFKLLNAAGEEVDIYLDLKASRIVMDRTKSGLTDFGELSVTHAIENHDRRKELSVNYVNDFALGTWAPLSKAPSHSLRIFVDRSSIELFLDGGKIAMTNLVFPTSPYNSIAFYTRGGACNVSTLTAHRLSL